MRRKNKEGNYFNILEASGRLELNYWKILKALLLTFVTSKNAVSSSCVYFLRLWQKFDCSLQIDSPVNCICYLIQTDLRILIHICTPYGYLRWIKIDLCQLITTV